MTTQSEDLVPVLAVDDQPENLLALEAIFAHSDLRLVRASSGQEALRHLLDEDFAVILMDAQMPEMDGFETSKIIRSRKKTCDTPIILVTATHRDSFHAAAGYDIGAVDYIYKPLVPEVLRAKVSVFVELFRKTNQIRRQAEELTAYKTELEKSLAQLQTLNEELQKTSKAADLARDQAIEASRFKSEFVAHVSHEIRTPMNGVLGMMEILMGSGLTPEQLAYANTIRDAGRSLLIVINDILDFSKVEAGKLVVEVSDFEPTSLVESIATLLGAQSNKTLVSLKTFIDPAIPLMLQGDSGRLRQVIMNLAGNALKFTDEGEVLIRADLEKREGDIVRVKFSVIDQGIGMTADEMHELFQPFVQTNPSGHRYGGTGLGLSISKRLVELLGGAIGVNSAKNQGSTFWFSVPLAVATGSDKPVDAVPELPEAVERTELILIAEDHPVNQQVALLLLQTLGFSADVADNGQEAVEMVRNKDYALVLMDCEMPVLDGFAATRKIRIEESESGKHTPIIAVTANVLEGIRLDCLSAGMDDYIKKPIEPLELKDALGKWVPEKSHS
ncbi:MAG: response regulator [Candidatus Obscuribacterales bacterium]|nr:response regulator [Candidatus Obscuribacterales bacterium]